jgi:hypothetical protein
MSLKLEVLIIVQAMMKLFISIKNIMMDAQNKKSLERLILDVVYVKANSLLILLEQILELVLEHLAIVNQLQTLADA